MTVANSMSKDTRTRTANNKSTKLSRHYDSDSSVALSDENMSGRQGDHHGGPSSTRYLPDLTGRMFGPTQDSRLEHSTYL